MKVKVISLPYVFQVLYVLCFTNVKISGERLQDHWSSGLHGCLWAFTSNQIHFEHDQIYRRFQEIAVLTFFNSEVVFLAIKNIAIFCVHVKSTFSNQIRFQIMVPVQCSSNNVSVSVIVMKYGNCSIHMTTFSIGFSVQTVNVIVKRP